MTLLITGANGFLGSSVVRKFQEAGQDVITITEPIRNTPGSVSCDLADAGMLTSVLKKINPKCIINLAAKVDFTADILRMLYPINSLCPAVLGDYCEKHDVFLIQASSIAVHDLEKNYFNINSSKITPSDYSISKFLAEKMVLASGCSSAIIRFSGIFGKNGPEHLGINRAIQQAKAGIKPTVIGSGKSKRNYIYVEDAADMIKKCLEERFIGVYFAGGEVTSIKEMCQSICDVWFPGESPVTVEGKEVQDQIVEVSPEFKSFRSFKDCLDDCR